MKCLYVSIAGCILKLVFTPNPLRLKSREAQNKLYQKLEESLKGFRVTRPSQKPAFTIEFIRRNPDLIPVGNITVQHGAYSLLYFHHRNNYIQTYQHLSINQFNYLLGFVLQYILSKHNGVLLHASAVTDGTSAHIFMGAPGAGKSTAMLLAKCAYTPIADDTVIVREIKKRYRVFQTPYTEKNYWIKKGKKSYLLGNLYFLRKAKVFQKFPITSQKTVINRLSKQLFYSKLFIGNTMKIIIRLGLAAENKFHYLLFAKDAKRLIRVLQA